MLPPGAHSRRLFGLDSWSRTRPPWAPPAATDGACLDRTSLADLCNRHGGRAHLASGGSLPEGPFLTLWCPRAEATETCKRRFLREPEGSGPVPRRHRPRRAKSPESACARRHRGQLLLPRAPQCRRLSLPKGWNLPEGRASRDPCPTSRANGEGRRAGLRRLPPTRSHPGSYSLVAAIRSPPAGDDWNGRAFFTNPTCPP